jgi:hypothetical protein
VVAKHELVALYGLSLNSFITVAADNLEMPVTCAWHLSDFCGVDSKLAPISYRFSLISTWHFLAGCLSRSDPMDLTLLISLRMSLLLETVFLGNLQYFLRL